MPYEIDLKNAPAGYSLTAGKPGEEVSFQYLEFTSTEDGQHFIRRLEGTPSQIIQGLSGQIAISPSQVDHLLAIIQPNGRATVYLNEIPPVLSIRGTRDVKKGDPITKDDIADIDRFHLGQIKIPADCGVVFVFSVGWRKGLYYDFGPLQHTPILRSVDLEVVLGQLHGQVLFQERFSVSDSEWQSLTNRKWFLFTGLKYETAQQIVEYVRANWNPDELLPKIIDEVKAASDRFLLGWEKHPVLHPHMPVLKRAVEHFLSADYLSCAALLYPRIEGIMRTNVGRAGTSSRSQDALVDGVVATRPENKTCLLLPHRFRSYLKEVYFASFDPDGVHIEASRHSVSHGVVSPAELDAKAAVLGILVVQQLFFSCEHGEASA